MIGTHEVLKGKRCGNIVAVASKGPLDIPALRRVFPKGTAEPVLQILRDLPSELIGGQDLERIQAALVLRTHGEWTSFKSNLALAHLDWRDALVRADLADQDWPQRLSANLDD